MQKLTILHKITYSALFIALGIILSRFLSIPALFGLPFLKVSLSVSVIIFSSFFLGPVWGALIGFLVDFLGAVLFPQGGSYDFLYSIPAFLQGLLPYFFYKLLEKIKVDRKYPIFLSCLILIFLGLIFWFTLSHDTFSYTATSKKYEFTPTLKVLITCLFTLFGAIFICGMYFINKKFKNSKINEYYHLYLIGSSVLLTFLLIKIPLSSWILSYRLNYTYEIIFGTRALSGFITSLIHTFIIILSLELTVKLSKKGAISKKEIVSVEKVEEIKENKNE